MKKNYKGSIKNGFDKITRIIGTIVIIALFISAASFFIYTKYIKTNDDNTMITADGWKKTDESRTESTEVTFYNIKRELKGVGELTTYEQEYSGSAEVINRKTGPITGHEYEITKNSVTFDYSGKIKVGYDFRDIDYDLSGDKIVVSIPKPQVFDNYAEASNVKENDNVFNDAKGGEAVTEKLAEEKDMELEKAVKDGIYDLAESNLKDMIEDQFAELSDCDIVFKTKLITQ